MGARLINRERGEFIHISEVMYLENSQAILLVSTSKLNVSFNLSNQVFFLSQTEIG